MGSGGHGKVIADIAIQTQEWENIYFLDDQEIGPVMGISVVGKMNEYHKYIKSHYFIVGIGNNSIREKIVNELNNSHAKFATIIHPNACIGSDVIINHGTVIMAGSIINSSTRIGHHSIINTGANVDHDNLIMNFVHISPGVNLAGGVKVGTKTWLGIGSSVINNIDIHSNCIIGAGSVVIHNIIIEGTYVGSPAKLIRKNS
ncbi:acetyltransferase [Alkalicoccus luteus]|uniref:acetyltransferase n=1 Tax=Alkalicoccus luteus TaxID=1237094 RepID=UPI0031B5A892